MIGEVLTFLRRHVDAHLRSVLDDDPGEAGADRVVFVDGDRFEPITFKLGAVSLLLINVEEERVFRNADPYVRVTESGEQQRVQPDIRLALYVLFVARFKRYDASWSNLSKIIEHFQTTRVIERSDTPELPAGVERLVFELVTQSFAQQNEVWNALRTTHLPSMLYRVRLVAFRDQKPAAAAPRPTETVIHVENRS